MLPRSVEIKLNRLVDTYADQHDATYHQMRSTFVQWLETTQMALEDEGVNYQVIERVLNRLVFGHPSGALAYERMELQRIGTDILSRYGS